MRKLVWMTVVAAGLSGSAAGEVFTWTGAVDGAWTNAANWTVGGVEATRCPGVCSNQLFSADGTTNVGWEVSSPLADEADFAAVAQDAATTVDFTGLWCVSSIVFKAGCSAYTLGSSSNDVVAVQGFAANGYKSGGHFDIEDGATVPTLVAGFSMGCSYIPLQGKTCYITISNKATQELVFATFGHSRVIAPLDVNSDNVNASRFGVQFAGTGDFRFNGPVRGVKGYSGVYPGLRQYMVFYFSTTGRIVFSTPQFGRGQTGTVRDPVADHGLLGMELAGTPYVEIQEGCRVSFSEWNDCMLAFSQSGTIGGAGTFQLCVQHGKGIGGNYGRTYVCSGQVGTIACNLDIYDADWTGRDPSVLCLRFKDDSASTGTFNVVGPTNALAGPVWFYSDPMTYRANKVANFGSGTTAYFRTSGTFEYAGPGDETFARDCFFVVNGKTATIRNTGTGTLTVASVFSPTNETYTGSSVVLSPETAPIRFTGTVKGAIPLVKAGAGTLVLAASIDWSGTSAFRLCAGAVDISELVSGETATIPVPVTFDTGTTTVAVPDGVTVKVPSLAATSGATAGTLNIRCKTGRVQLTADGATLPSGVTVNGSPASLDAEGYVVVPEPGYDVAIAARGDVVPNAASKTVAIMTPGTSGNDTLAEADTAVGKLVHYDGTDATVAIGDGRTLTAGTVEMLGLSGSLDVGAADDPGTLAGVDGVLGLANGNQGETLSIRAKLAEGTLVRVDEASMGPIALAGGTAGDVSLDLPTGDLEISGPRTTTLDGGVVGTNVVAATTATMTIAGAADVVLGSKPFHVGGFGARVNNQQSIGRLVVTNACVRNATIKSQTFTYGSTNEALCVGLCGDAVMDIQAGAVITNRLIVGGLYYWENGGADRNSHGRVVQTGGEMAVLGTVNVGDGSTIGTESGNGYYELRGGRLVWMGALSVGHYGYGAGSFAQFGGTSVFTNAYGSTSKPTIGPNAGANGGAAVMRFVGGRAEIHANVVLCGGWTNAGRSMMSVEDEADVDAADNTVKLCGANSSHNNFKWSKQGDVALVGGVLRAAGFFTGYSSSCPAYPQFYSVGFNGGTFRTGAASKDIAKAATSSAQAMTNFVVYAGGATVDTDGRTGNLSSTPFRGAWGKGVSGIPVASSLYEKTFIAAPYIVISGDGVGATAVADFDSASGKITGVRVLTPGVGYTKATAYFYLDTANAYTYTCALADNVNTGSFTKAGAGDFTLGAANTWGGKTVLKGGVLRLAVAGALPTASPVVYAGGALESTVAAAPAAFTAELPAEAVAAQHAMTLLTYTDGVPETAPEVTLAGIPDDQAQMWSVVMADNVVRLCCARGTVLIFR